MSSKQIVRDLLEKLPDEASLSDIAQEIDFVAGIRAGLDDLDSGRTLTADELRERLSSWKGSE